MDYVYTYEWYDGPRSGVASCHGQPYYYESQWADVYNQQQDWFKLSPIRLDLFEQELERWELWLNWKAAYDAGSVEIESHPYLPADRARGEELSELLDSTLKIDADKFLVAQAEFTAAGLDAYKKEKASMLVQWNMLNMPPPAIGGSGQ